MYYFFLFFLNYKIPGMKIIVLELKKNDEILSE